MFGLKIAYTEDEKERCAIYCESKGVKILPGTAFSYIEIEGDIKAVAGWHPDLGGTIEPLVSEGMIYTKHLGIFMYGVIAGKGYNFVTCWTNNKDWQDILKKEGFKIEETARLIKTVGV